MVHYKWEEMTQEEKYATFIGAINAHISLIKEELEKRPNKQGSFKAREIAMLLGPMFEELDDTTIFWGIKYALYPEGIIVDSRRENDTYLLIMRKL